MLCAGCASSAHAAKSTPAEGMSIGAELIPAAQRHALPPIVGTTLSGSRIALRELNASAVLVVNVWASWCENCREESAALAELARSLPPGRARFVGIDEQDTAAAARKVVNATGTNYPQLSDPTGAVLAKLSVLPSYGIPSTLLVDRNGMMAARFVGPVRGPQLQSLIDQIAGES
jgi:thiol-disulfide isomerase/thioredoxin